MKTYTKHEIKKIILLVVKEQFYQACVNDKLSERDYEFE